jgi:hypothetical protein
LKNFPKDPKEIRNKELRIQLIKLNNFLRKKRSEHKDGNSLANNFFKGVILPFDDSKSTNDEYNSIVTTFILINRC